MRKAYGSEKVIAIFLADIHLSLKPPVWRSAEPDWFEAQRRPLEEVRELQSENDFCPVLCAGDIFDRYKKTADGWNAPPELINFAIDCLPDNMYAIPGQHDLPNHQYDDIERSAYKTLAKAGKILNIPNEGFQIVNNLAIYAFPPTFPMIAPHRKYEFNIALVHDYIWIPGHSYPNAPDEKRLKIDNKMQNGKSYGYDIVVYGDNHKGFITHAGQTTVFNCGTLMRRKSDEIDYQPQVGLLLESGKVVSHYLDISKDKYLDSVDMALKNEQVDLDMASFISELGKLGKSALDFREAMQHFLHSGKTSVEAKQIIMEAMEK